MSQTFHISKNKDNLELRSHIIKHIREFFWNQNFLEVETPLIVKYPGLEPNLSIMGVDISNEQGKKFKGHLHTSPEYTMKKMLASGFENIFSICKCFRDEESFGGIHNPEFTMIEWYRTSCDMFKLMEDVEQLFAYVEKKVEVKSKKFIKFKRIHMRDLWKETIDINLDDYLEKEKMFELCIEKKYSVEESESYEELFYRIFLNEIEPKLKDMGSLIVHYYPAQMAALSKLSIDDTRYAERFEVYIDGVEIANAFSELTDKKEQLRRLKDEQEERKRLGKQVYDIDMEFIEALDNMPDSAGIALGIDRMVKVMLGCKNIDDVLSLPMSKIFK
ncbi:EF-P lysine aminoacylase GenX [Candidatus Parcubacteria bacterium]|jgi:elongation factor P--(R)-beta-lysine ligase|nr:EF-P lysine aminoacylase GenX [Candidatus Parcubacteria bacterium]